MSGWENSNDFRMSLTTKKKKNIYKNKKINIFI